VLPEEPEIPDEPLDPDVPDEPLDPEVPIVPEVSAATIPLTATRIPFSSLNFKSPEIKFCIANVKRI
jgi:hypothetical protein